MTITLLKNFFEKQQNEFQKNWPKNLVVAIEKYHSHYHKKYPADFQNDLYTFPFWILLPVWLSEKFSKDNNRKKDEKFINDILWAQHCIIVFLRIQDDILDHHTKNNILILAADQYLIEAEKNLEAHFPHSNKFWNFYHNNLTTTILSASRIYELQKNGNLDQKKLIEEYGIISAVFTIAAAAIVLKYNRTGLIINAANFIKEMSIAGQIIDDLEDIKEDIDNHKNNYTSSLLLNYLNLKDQTGFLPLKFIIKDLINNNIKKLFQEIRYHYLKANEELIRLDLSEGIKYLVKINENITILERNILKQIVNYLFFNFMKNNSSLECVNMDKK